MRTIVRAGLAVLLVVLVPACGGQMHATEPTLSKKAVQDAFAAQGIEFGFVDDPNMPLTGPVLDLTTPESRRDSVLLTHAGDEKLGLSVIIFKNAAEAQRYRARLEAAAKRYAPRLRLSYRRIRIGNILVFYSSETSSSRRADAAVEILKRTLTS